MPTAEHGDPRDDAPSRGDAFVEVRARRLAPTNGRALRAAALVGAMNFVVALLSVFQVPCTVATIETQSAATAAFEGIEDGLDRLVRFPGRRFAVAGRATGALLTLGACLPGVVIFVVTTSSSDAKPVLTAVFGSLLVAPLVLEVADGLERRVHGRG